MPATRPFPLVQRASVPGGGTKYEAIKKDLLEQFIAKVPESLYIPQAVVDNPPQDVRDIPRTCGILTAEEIDITENYDASGLAEAMAAGKLSAVSVATAFCKRAIIADQLSCCLTEWFMDEAVAQAQALDDHFKQTGKTMGPLHGVPISLKVHIPLAGHYSAVGFVSTIKKDDVDCQMVAILRRLGAVFYVKTNQPQSIMHLESVTPYGRVLNPYNIDLSAGGSTGGESALIALGGSVLGVGTDGGGSVRVPAAFCGLYGFKPTSCTLPMKDFFAGGFPAELNILISTGPLCRSLRDMDLFMSTILATEPFREDARIIPLPWTGLSTPRRRTGPLKIGIMTNDGVIQPQPPVSRALEWARSQLSQSKYADQFEIKPYMPYQMSEAIKSIRKAYWPDGGKGVKAALAATDEPMFALTQWIIADAEGPELSASEIAAMRLKRDEFRNAFVADWNRQDVDVVIAPAFVGPAPAHDTSFYWNYTALWNYVDYPGAVFPTPISAKADEPYLPENATPLGPECEHVRRLWEQGNFEGAPINLQILARRYHDNDLFEALSSLEEVLGL